MRGRTGLRRLLVRAAAHAPVRVFVVEGLDAPAGVDALRLHEDIVVTDTPRSAMVLLVAGMLPPAMHDAAAHVHDAMGRPRAVLQWVRQGNVAPPQAMFPGAAVLADDPSSVRDDHVAQELVRVLRRMQQKLLAGTLESSAPLLPDVDPAPWRGVGPYGQGGTGMTGGAPYGRPMTGRAPDRDGLELDQLPVRLGPFLTSFPAGLVLDVKLQGDVLQAISVAGNVFSMRAAIGQTAMPSHSPDLAPFEAALAQPVPIVTLERARARHHLRWLAQALRFHGLEALSLRVLRLAGRAASAPLSPLRRDVGTLRSALMRLRMLDIATAGVGRLDAAVVGAKGIGPIPRAAGIVEDARAADPGYAVIGFVPVVQSSHSRTCDARDRWRQRLDEAYHALELAQRAGNAVTGGPDARIEGPRGVLPRAHGAWGESPTVTLLAMLPNLLAGMEWGDAMTTIMSLDLDLREAAGAMSPPAPLAAPLEGNRMDAMGGMDGTHSSAQRAGRGDDHAGHDGHT